MSEKFALLTDVQKKQLVDFLDVREESGRSALFLAAEANRVKCADVLLRYKASTECANHSGVTPLGVACDLGHTAMILLLIEHQARVDVQVSGKDLVTCIVASVKSPKEKCEVVKALLANGCVVDEALLAKAKAQLPAEHHGEWDEAIKAAHEARAKNFSKAMGDAAPVPTDATNNAPMDEISAFLGFNQPLLQENKE